MGNLEVRMAAKAKIEEMLANRPGNKITIVYIYEKGGNLFFRPWAELREFSIRLDQNGKMYWRDRKLDDSPYLDYFKEEHKGKYSFVTYTDLGYFMLYENYDRILEFLTAA